MSRVKEIGSEPEGIRMKLVPNVVKMEEMIQAMTLDSRQGRDGWRSLYISQTKV